VEAYLPRENRKPKGSGKNPQEWGIVVRREDGTLLYYFVREGHVDSWGKPLGFWGRESQAHRFPSQEHARRTAATMQTNSVAMEYTVVRLTPIPPKR
jgi:hypothetical protein